MRITIPSVSTKTASFFNLLLTAVIAAATLVNVFLWRDSNVSVKTAQEQLTEIKRQDQGNLILQLNRDFFFNDRMYKLRTAIENGYPLLQKNNNGGQFTEQDLDDYLGIFEMMSGLIDKGILDKQLVDDNFGTYMVEAYQNKEIMTYVQWVRTNYKSQDYYSGFAQLAKQFVKE